MTFGFPAYHEEDVTLPMPVTHDWIVYACHTAGLGTARWGAGAQGGAWHLAPQVSLFSWGEVMMITPLAANVIRVRSECGLPTQCIDWGKNQKNVQKFVGVLVAAMQQAPQPPYR